MTDDATRREHGVKLLKYLRCIVHRKGAGTNPIEVERAVRAALAGEEVEGFLDRLQTHIKTDNYWGDCKDD